MGEVRVFGDYHIIKQVGQGSLGTVYLAEHRFMKRPFVLKMLPEELSSDRTFVQRLEEDISLLASLDHPKIVKIHNVSFAQGQYFLVSDCIVDDLGETTNLAHYFLNKEKRLEENEIFHILEQIAQALKYAHSKGAGKGISHRGIKPNNILIGKRGNLGPDVYLSDFGLSRIIGAGAVLSRTFQAVADHLDVGGIIANSKVSMRYPSPPLDQTKMLALQLSFIQNYSFLSPEQKHLETSQLVDIKTDVYAFGVLAYYLLMGEIQEGIFDMPSVKYPNSEWNWDQLIKSCLEWNPQKRSEDVYEALMSVKNNYAAKSVSFSIPSLQIQEEIETPSFTSSQKVVNQVTSGVSNLKPLIHRAHLERPETDHDPAAAFVVDTTVKYYIPERKEIKNIQPLLTDMIVIQGNHFDRGSDDGNRDEMPRHTIILNSYAIDIHPVTNEQFVRFLEAMGGEKDNNHQDIIRLRDSRIKRSGGKISIESGYAKHPVVGVTWYGAIAYSKWVGKRLPTEAEWEIASYGGIEGALYQTGDDIEKTQANFFSSDTTPVMSYAPNGYGLFDMAGNVYEWCHDWYGYNYYEISVQEPDDPKGPIQGVYRVLRGGCWKSLKEDLRCSRRHRNNPGTVNGTYGFRCAADVAAH